MYLECAFMHLLLMIQVLYVDFGNSETVSPDKLRSNLVLVDIPLQCQQCELFEVAPHDGKWGMDLLEYMHDFIVGKTCVYHVQVSH